MFRQFFPLLAMMALQAHAADIISDDFKRPGALDQSHPAGGPASWAADANFTTSAANGGALCVAAGPADASRIAVVQIPEAYITNSSLAMGLYTLRAELDLPPTGDARNTLDIGLGHISNRTADPWNASAENRRLFFATLGGDGVVNLYANPDNLTKSNGIKVTGGKAVITIGIDSRRGNLVISGSVNGILVKWGGADSHTIMGAAGKPSYDPFTGWSVDQLFVSDFNAGAGSIRDFEFTGDSSEHLYPTRLRASDPATWRPVPFVAVAPTGGVTPGDGGLFKQAMLNNVQYLLNSFSVNHMLYAFRKRHGDPHPPEDKPQLFFWDTDLRGSSAGRFLMGAGNTLRWMEQPELRKRLNEIVDGIDACKEPNGYILAYPPDQYRSEEPNYVRSWVTQGLIDAGISGNEKAWSLVRSNGDWFDHWSLLPKLTTVCGNAQQGQIASTRTYLSPVGKPEDLQVAEKYYVQDWWLDELAARHCDAIWRYPLLTPHSYLIYSFEAYMDLYHATGDKHYLDAMLGAWSLIHDYWEHIGGSMAICEGPAGSYPPGSHYITPDHHTGETCGSVLWIKFNERLEQYYPMKEKYANEIEKSIYNVCLYSQVGGKGVRYHAFLEGHADRGACINTCCEGMETMALGSLPEYIYSVAKDGLFVNLFEPSTISFPLGNSKVQVAMTSRFPYQPDVSLKVSSADPVTMKLRVRVPSWAASKMPILVNGSQVAIGEPGTYAVVDRTWKDGDTISFVLPIKLRLTEYHGLSQIPGHTRYALEYGPILMAAVGPLGKPIPVELSGNTSKPQEWIKPIPGKPLEWMIEGDPAHRFIPYWTITNETYTCFPVVDSPMAL